MKLTAKEIINKYSMTKHKEGGYFVETYRCEDTVIPPMRYPGKRKAVSMIKFLLNKNDFSAWHILRSDEIWTYCTGSYLKLYIISQQGELTSVKIGNEYEDPTCVSEFAIKSGLYFAAEVNDKSSFTLINCIVSPAFEFEDFRLANRDLLLDRYPQHSKIITRLTRPFTNENEDDYQENCLASNCC